MHKTWTDQEKEYIRSNAGHMKDADMVTTISDMRGKPISVQAIRKQRQKLGIAKMRGRGKCQVLEIKND